MFFFSNKLDEILLLVYFCLLMKLSNDYLLTSDDYNGPLN